MLFTVATSLQYPLNEGETAYLIPDNWNDWWEWQTMFSLVLFDQERTRHTLGPVKIGLAGMVPGNAQAMSRTPLPPTFDRLSDAYFSVGQSDDYYESLSRLEPTFRDRILIGLRDVVAQPQLLTQFADEDVLRISLLRSVSDERIRRFTRVLRGDAQLTRFTFHYTLPTSLTARAPTLSFDVVPESHPPTNIHVLIGRNGVGKTRCLQQMSLALLSGENAPSDLGKLQTFDPSSPLAELLALSSASPQVLFGNLVSVTFSAFDPFQPLNENDRTEPLSLPYAYVGLKSSPAPISKVIDVLRNPMAHHQAGASTKSLTDLTVDFVRSVHKCQVGPKRERWQRALALLQSDPLFKDSGVAELASVEEASELSARASWLYRLLSSGHKIVLLTITRLVETVEEKTLVLIDEPEAHLHPPLLSAFVRSLSDLLIQRNGVAVIATHSPVVLQEAPRSCVWILRRSGAEVRAERPELETFGENVGILTREVFGLEVTESGFHAMLDEAVHQQERSYEEVLQHFQRQLGAEARAIVRALVSQRDSKKG